METNETVPASATHTRKVVLALVALTALALALVAYLFIEYRALKQNPDIATRKQIEAVVAKVDKLIDLPEGELPTLATVSDTAELQGQPFFANAEVGDQVLLYANARKAYLYSPSKNIIIEVASLNIGE